MEDLSHLSKSQCLALEKYTALVGTEQMNHIVTQGHKVHNARFEAFMR